MPIDVVVTRLKQSLPRQAARLVIRALASRALESRGSFREVAPGRLQHGTVNPATETNSESVRFLFSGHLSRSVRLFATHAVCSVTVSCAKRSKPHGLCLSKDCLKRLSTKSVEKRRRLLRRQLRSTGSGIWEGRLRLRTFPGSARKIVKAVTLVML